MPSFFMFTDYLRLDDDLMNSLNYLFFTREL
jgi:hypothetical protein